MSTAPQSVLAHSYIQPLRIFLSCASKEFRSARNLIAQHFGALRDRPFEVRIQEDFQQGGQTLLDRLADYLRQCDYLIHLVGEASGARPTAEHVIAFHANLGQPPPAPLPTRSYTQWEYHLARQFNIKCLVYIADDAAPRDCALPVPQTTDESRLQQQHGHYIKTCGQHYGAFTTPHGLLREIFYDLGLNLEQIKIDNLPFKTLGTLFKGRAKLLQQLRNTLGPLSHRGFQRAAAITAAASAATVHGLGGIGKTRAAIEYAYAFRDEYTALIFLRADSPENLRTNLAALCGASVLDLKEKSATDIDVQRAAVLRWLVEHPGWFLILDNADTEAAALAVEKLLAGLVSSGHVLITSRLRRWSGAVESLPMDLLAEQDAADFLLERTAPHNDEGRRTSAEDPGHALVLARQLGQLALALEQAAAYIARHRHTFSQYLEMWRTQHDKVIEWFDERLMQYPKSVATTWQITFDALTPPARTLLNHLAWLAPDPIPESFLDQPLPTITDVLAPHVLHDGLNELTDYCLADRLQDPEFTIHQLVQDVTRHNLREEIGAVTLDCALHWMNDAFVGDPEDFRSWPVLGPLAAHAVTVAQFAYDKNIPLPTASLLNRVGLLFEMKAAYTEAEPLLRRALSLNEVSFGKDHPHVATNLINLASLLQFTNRLAEAEPLIRLAFAIDESSYGEAHPNVARDLINLSSLLCATYRLAEAEPLLRRALTICSTSYGKDHPKVAICLNNLASLLHDTNRVAEAEPLMREALRIDEAVYGRDHPRVAIVLNNLAQLLQVTNHLTEAELLMRRVLNIDEVCYGKDHPHVARDLNNLAQLLQLTNRLTEAEPLMREALRIDEASYGMDHPNVATDLNNLAWLLKTKNHLVEAEPLMRRALTINEASFGSEHPKVAMSLDNLAKLLEAANRQAEAEPLMRRALNIIEASDGNGHPNLAIQLNNLAHLLQGTGRPTEAEPLMRRALAIDKASFGKDHPHVATQLNNLAALFQATNRLTEAEPLMREALRIDEASYGKYHPNVARDLNNLALLLRATNRLSEAETLMRRALAIDEASFSRDHPNIAIRLNNLASILQGAKRFAEAEPPMRRQLEIFLRFTAVTGHPHQHLREALRNYAGLRLTMLTPRAQIGPHLLTMCAAAGISQLDTEKILATAFGGA